jgi:hypothetical protein
LKNKKTIIIKRLEKEDKNRVEQGRELEQMEQILPRFDKSRLRNKKLNSFMKSGQDLRHLLQY